jgi:hypothetical protein
MATSTNMITNGKRYFGKLIAKSKQLETAFNCKIKYDYSEEERDDYYLTIKPNDTNYSITCKNTVIGGQDMFRLAIKTKDNEGFFSDYYVKDGKIVHKSMAIEKETINEDTTFEIDNPYKLLNDIIKKYRIQMTLVNHLLLHSDIMKIIQKIDPINLTEDEKEHLDYIITKFKTPESKKEIDTELLSQLNTGYTEKQFGSKSSKESYEASIQKQIALGNYEPPKLKKKKYRTNMRTVNILAYRNAQFDQSIKMYRSNIIRSKINRSEKVKLDRSKLLTPVADIDKGDITIEDINNINKALEKHEINIKPRDFDNYLPSLDPDEKNDPNKKIDPNEKIKFYDENGKPTIITHKIEEMYDMQKPITLDIIKSILSDLTALIKTTYNKIQKRRDEITAKKTELKRLQNDKNPPEAIITSLRLWLLNNSNISDYEIYINSIIKDLYKLFMYLYNAVLEAAYAVILPRMIAVEKEKLNEQAISKALHKLNKTDIEGMGLEIDDPEVLAEMEMKMEQGIDIDEERIIIKLKPDIKKDITKIMQISMDEETGRLYIQFQSVKKYMERASTTTYYVTEYIDEIKEQYLKPFTASDIYFHYFISKKIYGKNKFNLTSVDNIKRLVQLVNLAKKLIVSIISSAYYFNTFTLPRGSLFKIFKLDINGIFIPFKIETKNKSIGFAEFTEVLGKPEKITTPTLFLLEEVPFRQFDNGIIAPYYEVTVKPEDDEDMVPIKLSHQEITITPTEGGFEDTEITDDFIKHLEKNILDTTIDNIQSVPEFKVSSEKEQSAPPPSISILSEDEFEKLKIAAMSDQQRREYMKNKEQLLVVKYEVKQEDFPTLGAAKPQGAKPVAGPWGAKPVAGPWGAKPVAGPSSESISKLKYLKYTPK